MKQRATVYEEAIALLRTLPEEAAQDVLQRLRSGTDITTVVNHVQAGDVLLQMAVVPESQLRYVFPYRSEMPEVYIRDNPYLESRIYEAAFLLSPQGLAETSTGFGGETSQELQSAYLRPFHSAHVVDSRLPDAKISSWTSVCQDDPLMRDLLGAFFRCEYQFAAAFHKDLFLEDLVSHGSNFCSSLLVNIVLAYACVRPPLLPSFHSRRLT